MFHSKRSYWRKLDNAAKLFPATSNKKGHSSLSFLLYYERRCKRRDFAAGSGKSA